MTETASVKRNLARAVCDSVHVAPLNPTTVDPSRTADEGEAEDERDDEMSEPTQTKKTENRK